MFHSCDMSWWNKSFKGPKTNSNMNAVKINKTGLKFFLKSVNWCLQKNRPVNTSAKYGKVSLTPWLNYT